MQPIPFGFHFLNEGFDTTGDLINKVPMKVVKFAGLDMDWLKDPNKIGLLKAAKAKGALVVGRRGTGNDGPNLDRADGNMVAEALAWFLGQQAGLPDFKMLINAFPEVDVWEGPNEVACTTPLRMQRYAAAMVEFARLIKQAGRLAALGNWATGNPDYPLWKDWVPVLKTCVQNGHFLSRHVYGALDRDCTFRYRNDNDAFAALGYHNVPLIITEFGADKNCGYGGTFRKKFGTGGGAAGDYWKQYLKLAVEGFAQDPYVVGATVFTVGNGGSAAWNDFDLAHTDIAGQIVANPPNMSTAPAPVPPVVPVVPKPPVPAPVVPPVPVSAPVLGGATHVVTAAALNVREFPWLGNIQPPGVGILHANDQVTVWASVTLPGMTHPYQLIDTAGNRWVSGLYLKKI